MSGKPGSTLSSNCWCPSASLGGAGRALDGVPVLRKGGQRVHCVIPLGAPAQQPVFSCGLVLITTQTSTVPTHLAKIHSAAPTGACCGSTDLLRATARQCRRRAGYRGDVTWAGRVAAAPHRAGHAGGAARPRWAAPRPRTTSAPTASLSTPARPKQAPDSCGYTPLH